MANNHLTTSMRTSNQTHAQSSGKNSWADQVEDEEKSQNELGNAQTLNPKSWSNVVEKTIISEGFDLEREGETSANVKSTLADMQEEIEYWQSAVVCYVLGSNPLLTVIEGFFKRMWGHLGLDKVAQTNKGVFMVRFHSVEGRTKAVERGTQTFDRKPVVVKPWKPWLVDKPVKADTTTTRKEKLMYARVMVEVPLNKTYPDTIMFENELGQIIEQTIEYKWKPTLCDHCRNFGHIKEHYRKLQVNTQMNQAAQE
ncbi:uncharacterized protein [Nicotiana sylvestris]|uniref:uncharacterized protein n=1 Tax=Nicotiana sylvestris TaxID=4096 RepID=UPI00388CBD17